MKKMAQPIESVTPSPYLVYKKKAVSDACEHGFVEYFYSRVDVRNGVLDFVVEGNSDHMIVPAKSFLKVVVELTGSTKKVTGQEQKTVADGANVGVVNNLLHSMFESAEVSVSNQATTKVDKHNGYCALLQTLCNYDEDAWRTYFKLSGWEKDTAGKMESINDKENVGYGKRKQLFKGENNKRCELIGKIFSPLFFQDKVLPTQTSMRVLLKKKNDEFVLMHEEGDFQLKIVDAVLMVQKVSLVSGLRQSINQMLEEGKPIPYFLNTPSVNFYTIEEGSSQYIRDNLFLGRVPQRIVIGMVETEAYHGKRDKNPYNFQHFGITEICLYKDGVPYPRPMIKMDFEHGMIAEAYHHFMTSLGGACSRIVPLLTMDDYMSGYTLFSYDMSPDQMGSTCPGSLLNLNSNIRLEMKFKKPLEKNITLLVYYQMDQLMEIHRDRRVTIDF